MLRDLVRRLLVGIGAIRRPDLIGHIIDHHPTPAELPAGVLLLVQDGNRQKWACFRCPGGCGEKLQLSLNMTRRPRWAVSLDWLLRPTVTPSVHQLNACRCHFWIKQGMIEWCGDSGRHSPGEDCKTTRGRAYEVRR